MKELSVVVALYNELDNVELLLKRLTHSLQDLSYELILVDDGSTDGSAKKIAGLLKQGMKLILLRKNYGQTAALSAGITASTGKYIVTMDADLQNDPADIPAMLQKLKEGDWELVAGIRVNRQDNTLLRKFPSRIANKLIRLVTGVTLHDYGCTLKIFQSDTAKHLGLYGDMHRFIPVLAALHGSRMTEMAVQHHPRIHGKSKYGISRTIFVLSDLILVLFLQKYFQRPMHIFGPVGITLFLAGLLINFYLLVLKLGGADIANRPLLILGVILFLAGLQLILSGIMTEILMRTYYEAQHKKFYTIRSIINGNHTLAE